MSAADPKAEAVSPGAVGSVEKVDRGGTGDSKVVAPKASASKKKVVAPISSAFKKKAGGPKPKKPRVADDHPKYSVMIADAISQMKERKGSSRQAILQYVTSHYKLGSEVNRINAQVKMALKSGVKSGLLNQVKGWGASGSFRLGQQQKSLKKAAHPKTPMVKQPTGSAKKTVKKSKNPVGRPVGRPKTAAKKKAPAKKAKSPAKKGKSPAKKPTAGPKKVKAAASKAKPKSAAKNKQKKPVKKTGKK